MNQFRGVTNIGRSSTEEILKTNLISYLDWGFLSIGAFFNVTLSQNSAYGGDESVFTPVNHPDYVYGQVWQAFRGNWVYETGVPSSLQPINYSGVYIDGTFHPHGVDHYVDYRNGQIVFTNPVNTNATVKAEYSYKLINIYDSDYIPWFREVQPLSLRAGDNDVNDDLIEGTKLQLPAVVVEVVEGNYAPYQLGGGFYVRNDVIFHVMSHEGHEAARIAEIISNQIEKTIKAYDPDVVAESGAFPLDYRGEFNSGAPMYPDLVEQYYWGTITFTDSVKQKTNVVTNGLVIKPVRMTTEVVLPLA